MSLRIVGRSSSHFTRIVRVFAHELEVPYEFQPVFDLMSQRSSDYADNPALKLPVLETEQGAWFGTLNICRELARRSQRPHVIVWPEQLSERSANNAQELVLQGMASVVGLVMRQATQPKESSRYDDKTRDSLQNSLDWLEAQLPSVLASLPAGRTLAFLEVSAFCFVAHLAFRQLVDLQPYAELVAFCEAFAARASARATEYRFDRS